MRSNGRIIIYDSLFDLFFELNLKCLIITPNIQKTSPLHALNIKVRR